MDPNTCVAINFLEHMVASFRVANFAAVDVHGRIADVVSAGKPATQLL